MLLCIRINTTKGKGDLMPGQNEYCLNINDKEIILIGTAHISKKSAEEVKAVIEREQPDSVCIELCPARYQSISDKDKWKKTDIIKIIKEKKALLMLANLVLSSYQKRMAKKFGIQAGQEMIQGIESAREVGAQLVLADRNIQTTFSRIWRSIGLGSKMRLFFQLVLSVFSGDDVSEEDIEKLKSSDMLSSALNEIATAFPELKSVLVDERDKYLAQKIKEAPGKKIVAVLGAGHIPGITREIYREQDLKKLTEVPPASKVGKIVLWGIPLLVIALIISTFSVDRQAGLAQIESWILWNGTLAALGTLLAWGHPLSIATAFVAAPISSLNPLLAAGWFAGLSEAFMKKPNVEDFENLPDDITSFGGFWRNKVTHILLVVALANLGSMFGTMFGGADIIRMFLETLFH